MPRRLVNDLLWFLVLAQVATGLVGWAWPTSRVAPLYDLHRLLGAALLVVLVWKQQIVRDSLARRARPGIPGASVVRGLLAGTLLLASVAIGLAWTLHLVTFDTLWGYSPLNLHVFLAVGLLPLLLWHAVGRLRQNVGSPPFRSRRGFLHAGAVVVGTLALGQALERLAVAANPPGFRAVTGSKHAGSFSGTVFPVTTWLFDAVPPIDVASWRLTVRGVGPAPMTLSYDDLAALPAGALNATLDCTSGWWSRQVWQGVRIGDLLSRQGLAMGEGRSVVVTSVTGHSATVPLAEARAGLIATHVGGEPLTPGHGFPARLVLPDRRGYQWVKWIASLEVV